MGAAHFYVLLALVLICAGSSRAMFGVVYNSSSALQQKLYLATWMGFRDSNPDDTAPPRVYDLHSHTPKELASWILNNRTTRLVSLLQPDELVPVLEAHKCLIIDRVETGARAEVKDASLLLVLPRECIDLHSYILPSIDALFRIECLETGARETALALLHRVRRVGVTRLVPLTTTARGNGAEAEAAYRVYKEMTFTSRAPFELARMHSLRELQSEIKTAGTRAMGNSSNKEVVGVLVLDREPGALARVLKTVATTQRLVYIFTPWGTEGIENAGLMSPLYTVMYASAANEKHASIARRRLLPELVDVLGGSDPLLLTAVLAYDAATRAVDPSRAQLLSGPFDPQPLSLASATRARTCGIFYGLSPKPTHELAATRSVLLQQSELILEDVVTLDMSKTSGGGAKFEVVDYQVPTATVISATDLTALASTAEERISCKARSHGARITTWDPISGMPSTYGYGYGLGNPKSQTFDVPDYLLIPNKHGFAMELSCEHDTADTEDDSEPLVTSVSIACTPAAVAGAGSGVNCYRSGFKKRVRRAATAAYADARSMSMSVSTTSEEPSTTTEVPTTTTTAAPAAPLPPLTDLRGILKAAKPFIGGCIGTQLGCAICAIFLSRSFPTLATQPAICAGSCFTNTFSQCGGLLGRVGSETTVICTELFRQGRIDAKTFLADAEFGRWMQEEASYTLKGYRILAAPLVRAMRASEWVTDVVVLFAEPWARHMKDLVGKGEPDGSNWVGVWIHWTGAPICEAVGRLAAWVDCVPGPFCPYNALQWACLLFLGYFVLSRKKTRRYALTE